VSDEVDRFVKGLELGWQRYACAEVLEDIRSSATFVEHLKWRHPYFELNGSAVLKWFCAKGWINVYFFRGCELTDTAGLFELTNNTKMRTVRIYADTNLYRQGFRDLITEAADLAAA